MTLILEDHIFRVLENLDQMLDFLGEYDWGFNKEKGVLTFTRTREAGLFGKGTRTELIAECKVQVLGTLSEQTSTWLWAWANVSSQLPAHVLSGVDQVKREGEKQNLQQFVQAQLPVPTDEAADALAIACVGHLGYFTYFICPYAGGAMYVSIESFPQVTRLPRNAQTVMRAIQSGISVFEFSHPRAVQAYLGKPASVQQKEVTWNLGNENFLVEFDDQKRIAKMGATLL